MDESIWRQFTDPHGYFRVNIPASWHVDQSESALTQGQHERTWHGTRFMTNIFRPEEGKDVWRMSVTIRIEQFNETPPPTFKGLPEPTDLSFLRTYLVAYDSDWLSSTVGHIRVHIQYDVQHIASGYRAAGWEAPAPLSLDEQHRRRALVHHIINSFELLVSG